MHRRTFLAGCWAYSSATSLFGADPAPGDIQKLIAELGNKKYKEREAAARALAKIGERARSALEMAAARYPDVEVRQRAKALLRSLDKARSRVVRVFAGHEAGTLAIDLSPDCRRVLSSGLDSAVRLWDAVNGDELRCFHYAPGALAFALAFAPTGRHAVLGGKIARYVELPSGHTIRLFQKHTDLIRAVAFSADARLVASGDQANVIRVWDVRTGAQKWCLRGHTERITAVKFLPRGSELVSASVDASIRLWDLIKGVEAACLNGHKGIVQTIAIARRNRWVVSGGLDNTARLWDLQHRKELHCFRGHSDMVAAVAFRANDSRVLTASLDGSLREWDVNKGTEYVDRRQQPGPVDFGVFSRDEKMALLDAGDDGMRLWRLD